eukprot:m.191662 g.191662  ORF g.191662 m.191662 type:complete len:110 (-) comp18597_c0_seq13:167-496(-)
MLAALCQKKTRKLLTDSCARQALLPVQLLSAVFLGIGGGLSIFVLTRKFYHTGDVLKAMKMAHKSQASRLKKISKTVSAKTAALADVKKSTKPTLSGRQSGKAAHHRSR